MSCVNYYCRTHSSLSLITPVVQPASPVQRQLLLSAYADPLPHPQGIPHGESIDWFLARRPNPWQKGESRPTPLAQVRPARHRRTRRESFEGVWYKGLLWLQKGIVRYFSQSLEPVRISSRVRAGVEASGKLRYGAPGFASPAHGPLDHAPELENRDSQLFRL